MLVVCVEVGAQRAGVALLERPSPPSPPNRSQPQGSTLPQRYNRREVDAHFKLVTILQFDDKLPPAMEHCKWAF